MSEKPSVTSDISEEAMARGLDVAALDRLAFRLNFLEDQYKSRMDNIRNEKVTSFEVETHNGYGLLCDLIDTFRECLVLARITLAGTRVDHPSEPEGQRG